MCIDADGGTRAGQRQRLPLEVVSAPFLEVCKKRVEEGIWQIMANKVILGSLGVSESREGQLEGECVSICVFRGLRV